MALTSALFTGLSGLDVNQQRMNVVGNNIANVNTVAFKSSRALFKPQFYVTDAGGSAPSDVYGGTNPSQRGLGASVASIQKDFTEGSIEPTGKPTDLAVDGTGFFVVQGGQDQRYTRDGSFVLNSANQLVTTGGDFVQGFGVDGSYNIVAGKLQNLTIPLGAASTAQATQKVTMEGNLDAGGAIASGASILGSQALTTVGGAAAPVASTLLTSLASGAANATPLFAAGQQFTLAGQKGSRDLAPESFVVNANSTLGDLMNFYQGALGINTTVPAPPGGPTPGLTVQADTTDPNSVHLLVTGNAGKDNALKLSASSFRDAAGATPLSFNDAVDAAGLTSNASGESAHTTVLAYDSLGTPLNIDLTATYEKATPTGTTWRFYAESADSKAPGGNTIVGTGELQFDNQGKFLSGTGLNLTLDRTGTGAKSPLSLKLDFAGMTALSSRVSDFVMSKQDGSPLGSLSSFSIGSDGVVTGSFSNGLTRPLGQVALATFNNPQGLEDKGSNLYATSANSGAAIITQPIDLGSGTIRSGALELSNVDLSKEFINLIIASTGFSAASRVISTSNQLITELLNTSR